MRTYSFIRQKPTLISSGYDLLYNGETIINPPNRNERDFEILGYFERLMTVSSEDALKNFADIIDDNEFAEEIVYCDNINEYEELLYELFDEYFVDFYKELLMNLFDA